MGGSQQAGRGHRIVDANGRREPQEKRGKGDEEPTWLLFLAAWNFLRAFELYIPIIILLTYRSADALLQ
jgi:hypothetical protein